MIFTWLPFGDSWAISSSDKTVPPAVRIFDRALSLKLGAPIDIG
jgi:hypothetical protein